MNPGDIVRTGTSTATVICRTAPNRIRVRGLVCGRGPYVQHWYTDGVEIVERASQDRPTAAVEEQRRIDATDPNIDVQDRPRVSGQNAAILERLRRGPATNAELAAISLKYTSRLSDLRKHGYKIESRKDGGTWVYTLR